MHTPDAHVWSTQATALPQAPPAHVCTPLPEHCVAPDGLHAPTHAPPMQVPLVHATAALQAVQPSPTIEHVCTPAPEHCVVPRVQALAKVVRELEVPKA